MFSGGKGRNSSATMHASRYCRDCVSFCVVLLKTASTRLATVRELGHIGSARTRLDSKRRGAVPRRARAMPGRTNIDRGPGTFCADAANRRQETCLFRFSILEQIVFQKFRRQVLRRTALLGNTRAISILLDATHSSSFSSSTSVCFFISQSEVANSKSNFKTNDVSSRALRDATLLCHCETRVTR